MRALSQGIVVGALLTTGPLPAQDPPEWRLPGADAPPAPVLAAMAERWRQLGSDHEPRTEHLDADGEPLYTNRLILESSPYLLQHAHNPVDWRPWGDDTLAEARRLDRPILLSIGYSTCHWCHVMERESFDDPEIAAVLNTLYVPIKVDREERPDVDTTYMTAVQLLRREGGWPLTVWLTPDGRPFYGSTYLPPRDGDRGSRLGFLTYLVRLRQAWDESRAEVERSADEIAANARRYLEVPGTASTEVPGLDLVDRVVAEYDRRFDEEWGGLQPAPKFPSSMSIRLLLRHHVRTGDARSLRMAVGTLDAMAAGGIHDALGGGFHRYAVDRRWRVPHFEKMLYDNARLAGAYLEAFQVTGDEAYAQTARGILDYLQREMLSPEGGFYSATDADSLGPDGELGEGYFFTWTAAEIRSALTHEQARVALALWGVDDGAELEGRHVLHATATTEDVATSLGLPTETVVSLAEGARERLYETRSARPAPLRDDKILTAWNSLAISAFARAGHLLDERDYLEIASRAADRLLAVAWHDGGLLRYYLGAETGPPGVLEDYAFFVAALLDLYETTWRQSWLERALEVQAALDGKLGGDGAYRRSETPGPLGDVQVPVYDGALPTGNAVSLSNLLRLAALTTDDAWRERADRLLAAVAPKIDDAPGVAAELLVGLERRHGRPREVALIAPPGGASLEPFLARLRERLLPLRVLVVAEEGEDLRSKARSVPLLSDKRALDGAVTAYVCEHGLCKLPTSDPDVFARQLDEPVFSSD